MLKLTREQIHQAKQMAEQITELQTQKNVATEPQTVSVNGLAVQISAAQIRAELDRMLTAERTALAELGIELVPT